MGTLITWDQVAPPSSGNAAAGSGKGKFFRFEAGKSHRVRPLGRPVVFYKFFHEHNGQVRTAVCDEKTAKSIEAKHGVNASRKYAIVVIDRADGELRIMEGGSSIFEELRKYFEMTQEEPGSGNGGDFVIDSILPSDGNRRRIRYQTKFKEKTPVTADERKLVEERADDFKLTDIYKSLSEEEVEKRLFSDDPYGKKEAESAAAAGKDNFQWT